MSVEGDFDAESGLSTQSSSGSTRSQSASSSGGRKKRKLPSKPVRMNFTEDVAKQFERDYGIIPIVSSSMLYHSHPHLAYQRNVLELEALKIATKLGKVCDVGSAARAVRHYRGQIHCMVPNMQEGDVTRLRECTALGAELCEHRLQDCTCGPFDVLLFVHSCYYFTYQELKDALQSKSTKGTAFVVGHEFPEGFGHFGYHEGNYEVRVAPKSKELFVVSTVKGNQHKYSHKPLLWELHREVGDHESHLDVELLRTVGDTKLWQITLMDGPVKPEPNMHWKEQVVDTKHMGPVTIPGNDHISRQSTATNELRAITINRIHGWGPILWTETTTGIVVMPRGVIAAAATSILYGPRDPATFRDVVHNVKGSTKIARMPAELQLVAATVATVLAFNYNVKAETEYANHAAEEFSWMWKLHAKAITLTPLKIVSFWTLVFWAVVSFVITLLVFVEIPWDHRVIGSVLFIGWFVCVGLSCCVMCLAERQRATTSEHWGNQLYHEGIASNITGTVDNQPARTRFPANSSLREPLLAPESAVMDVGPDAAAPRHPGRRKDAIILAGGAFSTAVPSVAADNQSSEIVALTHRVLREPTKVLRSALEQFRDLSSTKAGRALQSIKVKFNNVVDFGNWVRQPKFNETTRQRFITYWDKFKSMMPPPSIFKSFVKIEKNKTHTMEGPPKLKPRLISGPWDAVKAMCGFAVAKIYSAVRSTWNGVDCPVLYASGMTPDGIGALCDKFAEEQGGWENILGVWWDFVCYDSSLQNELLEMRELYRAWGMDDLTYAWLQSPRNAGVTKHGIKYSTGKKIIEVNGKPLEVEMRTLYSGEMDTNLIGTLINGTAGTSGVHGVEITFGLDVRFLLLVCGDDGMMFVNKADWCLEYNEYLKEYFRNLGLEVEMGVSANRWDWEFCSKLFWWGEDVQTKRRVTVLGPKPGRLLSRFAFNLTLPGAQNLRGALVSLAMDTAHIPLINVYVSRFLHLTTGMKEKGKAEYSELKHVSKRYAMVPENLAMLENRYGLGYEHVTAFEDAVAKVTTAPCVLHFPWIEGMVKRDEM